MGNDGHGVSWGGLAADDDAGGCFPRACGVAMAVQVVPQQDDRRDVQRPGQPRQRVDGRVAGGAIQQRIQVRARDAGPVGDVGHRQCQLMAPALDQVVDRRAGAGCGG